VQGANLTRRYFELALTGQMICSLLFIVLRPYPFLCFSGNSSRKLFILCQAPWVALSELLPLRTFDSLGFGESQTVLKAFHKIQRNSGSRKFNRGEIIRALQKSVPGVSYVQMSARARNIQKRP
jgi:hypothetical protein